MLFVLIFLLKTIDYHVILLVYMARSRRRQQPEKWCQSICINSCWRCRCRCDFAMDFLSYKNNHRLNIQFDKITIFVDWTKYECAKHCEQVFFLSFFSIDLAIKNICSYCVYKPLWALFKAQINGTLYDSLAILWFWISFICYIEFFSRIFPHLNMK